MSPGRCAPSSTSVRLRSGEVEEGCGAQLGAGEGAEVDLVGAVGELNSSLSDAIATLAARTVTRIGASERREHDRGVTDGARHRPGHAADVGWIDGNAAQGRLERERQQ